MTDSTNIEHHRLPDALRERLPGFENTPEYLVIRDTGGDLPDVVCGALGSLLQRLEVEMLEKRLDAAGRQMLDRVYRVIEELATSNDIETVNAVVVDVLELLSNTPLVVDRITARLGPATRALYDRWIIGPVP